MDKKVEQYGDITGKLLIFGGIYSNLQALQALIEVSRVLNIPAENSVCTGDIVGYCAQPEETVQLFREWGARSIAGNVELQLFEGAENCGCDFTEGSRCDGFSKLWYPFAQGSLSMESVRWMGELPKHLSFRYAGKKVTVLHGSVENVSEYIFESTSKEVKLKNFYDTESDVILAGHSGLPFHEEVGDKLWLNAGVIGMPANDGTQRVWYLILEQVDGKLICTHHYLEYDADKSNKLMQQNNLPIEYAHTLLSGLWDNMEILPEAEKKLQGKPYNFNNYTIENPY